MGTALQNFLTNAVSGILCAFGMGIILRPNRLHRLGLTVYIAAVILFMGTQFFVLSHPIQWLNSLWNLIFYLFVICCFTNPVREAICGLVVLSLCALLGVYVLTFPLQITGILLPTFIVGSQKPGSSVLAIAALCIAIPTSAKLMQRFDAWRRLPNWALAVLLIMNWAGTIFYDTDAPRFQMEEKGVMIFAMGMICFCVCFCVFFFSQKRMVHQSNQMIRQQQSTQLHYYQLLVQEYRMLDRFKEEMRGQIDELRSVLSCGDEEQSAQVLERIRCRLRATRSPVRSGNAAVDALLQSKMEEIRQKKCHVQLALTFPEKLGIRDIDLVCVLANLLDNALHAVQQEQTIWISAHSQNGVFVLTVKNPTNGAETIPKRLTAKKFTINGHGLGLSSVQSTVEQYDGQFSLRQEGKMVVACAIMTPRSTEEETVR